MFSGQIRPFKCLRGKIGCAFTIPPLFFFVNKPHLRDREIGNGNSNIKQKLFSAAPSHAELNALTHTHTSVSAHLATNSKHTWDEMHAAANTHTEAMHVKWTRLLRRKHTHTSEAEATLPSLRPGRVSDTKGYNSLHFEEAFQAMLTSVRLERGG